MVKVLLHRKANHWGLLWPELLETVFWYIVIGNIVNWVLSRGGPLRLLGVQCLRGRTTWWGHLHMYGGISEHGLGSLKSGPLYGGNLKWGDGIGIYELWTPPVNDRETYLRVLGKKHDIPNQHANCHYRLSTYHWMTM